MLKRLIATKLVKFLLDNKYIQKVLIKNKLAQAIFSKEGPYRTKPEVTSSPRVIPNKYRLSNNNKSGKPNFKREIPKRGMAIITAGIRPISVRISAVQVKATIISPIFRGETNRLIKFLLHISSKKSIL